MIDLRTLGHRADLDASHLIPASAPTDLPLLESGTFSLHSTQGTTWVTHWISENVVPLAQVANSESHDGDQIPDSAY